MKAREGISYIYAYETLAGNRERKVSGFALIIKPALVFDGH